MFDDPIAALPSVLVVMALVIARFSMTHNIGYDWSDEGYLWYGTLRTSEGRIPIRDFRGYDPGRYYWCALWMRYFGRGILGVRKSAVVFQLVGVGLAVFAIHGATQHWWVAMSAGAIMAAWMHPRHKLFDCAISIIGVVVAGSVLENPDVDRMLVAGVFTGLTMVMGANHFIYNFFALCVVNFYLWIFGNLNNALELIAWFGVGLVIGASPLLVMFVCIPRMFTVYVDRKVKPIIRRRTTNLRLPVPWPWRRSWPPKAQFSAFGALTVQLLFLLLPICYGSTLVWAFVSPSDVLKTYPLLVGAALVGVFYMHHAFSRADLPHLSQSIQPFLIVVIAAPYEYPAVRGLAMCALAVMTYYAIVVTTDPWLIKRSNSGAYVSRRIGTELLCVHKGAAQFISLIEATVSRYTKRGESIVLLPNLIGLYPLLNTQAPMYDTYPVHPAPDAAQLEMLEAISSSQANLAVVHNWPLDGRDDLRFQYTYPRVWSHFTDEFDSVDAEGLPGDLHVFVRRLQHSQVSSTQG